MKQTMRQARFVLVVAAALCAAPAARAGDEIPAEVKEAIAYFDKYSAKAKDDGKFAGLVADLAATQDPAAATRIAKILETDRNNEHQAIAADALGDFKKNPEGKEAAGKALCKALTRDLEIEMQINVLHSIGQMKYVPGCMPVCDAIKKFNNPWVRLHGVRTLGRLNDLHALPTLLYLLDLLPHGIKEEAGAEVKVDTGTAGDGDQQAAEAAYNAANPGMGHGAPPVDNKVYKQELKRTVHKLTNDETIEDGDALRLWMIAHAEQLTALGIEIPTPPKEKKDKDKDEKGATPKK
jgi:hypothetical protein